MRTLVKGSDSRLLVYGTNLNGMRELKLDKVCQKVQHQVHFLPD